MRALDVTCPTCGALPGERCGGSLTPFGHTHQARINAAIATTREANRAARDRSGR